MNKYDKERASNKKLVSLHTISTHVPSKWVFVDLETGDTWFNDKAGKMRKHNLQDLLELAGVVVDRVVAERAKQKMKKGQMPRKDELKYRDVRLPARAPTYKRY